MAPPTDLEATMVMILIFTEAFPFKTRRDGRNQIPNIVLINPSLHLRVVATTSPSGST